MGSLPRTAGPSKATCECKALLLQLLMLRACRHCTVVAWCLPACLLLASAEAEHTACDIAAAPAGWLPGAAWARPPALCWPPTSSLEGTRAPPCRRSFTSSTGEAGSTAKCNVHLYRAIAAVASGGGQPSKAGCACKRCFASLPAPERISPASLCSRLPAAAERQPPQGEHLSCAEWWQATFGPPVRRMPESAAPAA